MHCENISTKTIICSTKQSRQKLFVKNQHCENIDNIADAATFQKKDPFDALDLSDPSNPKVLGTLDISGFSSYLYPMNEDSTLIFALGEDEDEDGVVLGLQITVFDVQRPGEPMALHRYSIEQDRFTDSSSEGLRDFKAVRYAAERLIITVDIDRGGSFSSQGGMEIDENLGGFFTSQGGVVEIDENFGFFVFIVNKDKIEPSCRIPDRDRNAVNTDICYYCAYLPPRSFIFGGNVMTTKNHFIRSTDLDTCEKVWSLDVHIQNEDSGGCCGNF